MNEFVAMLPSCERTEAEALMNEFVQDFRDQGIRDIWARGREHALPGQCVEFTVRGGVAQGRPTAEFESIIAEAKRHEKEIGRFTCERGE